MSKSPPRGSKLHMQQLVQLPDLEGRVAELARCAGLNVSGVANCHPNATDGGEMGLRRFCERYMKRLYENGDPFQKWWTPYGGKPPTYDLLCTFGPVGYEGIICVEAKAWEGELKEPRPKRSSSNPERRAANSRCIHCRIVDALSAIWGEHHPAPDWDGDRYQLYNRLAWGHRLAELGVDVVIMYLGFADDQCWPKHAIEGDKWRGIVRCFADGVLPPNYVNSPHRYGRGTFWFRTETTPVPDSSRCRARKSR